MVFSLLRELGIDVWKLRDKESVKKSATDASREHTLQCLQQAVAACTACPLHVGRTQTVFGTGNPHAKLMLIGEAPGYHEDQQGKPFVGRAGQLLTAMLQAIGFSRDDVYIANIIKCRPPDNRDPTPSEIAHCRGYLEKQIATIQPKIVLLLGRIAAHALLDTTQPLAQLRGAEHHYQNTPTYVTYHPAYLLRNPVDKRRTYRDLQAVAQALA